MSGRRVLIVGAGALGSVYGAMLARSGVKVQLLAREVHVRAIHQAGGVKLELDGASELVPVDAEWRADRVDGADVVILATKAYDSREALAKLGHIRGGVRLAFSVQNVGDKNDVLAAWCGLDAVVGGTSAVGGTLLGPGWVCCSHAGATFVGELPGGTSPRVEEFVAMLRGAGLPAHARCDVLDVEWTKLVNSVPVQALAALTRRYLDAIMLDPDLAVVFARLARETATVAAAAGCRVVPGIVPTAVDAIVRAASDEQAVDIVRETGRAMNRSGITRARMSMLQSVERGKRLEVEGIHGYVVRDAARRAVAVPTVELCYRLLASIDRDARHTVDSHPHLVNADGPVSDDTLARV